MIAVQRLPALELARLSIRDAIDALASLEPDLRAMVVAQRAARPPCVFVPGQPIRTVDQFDSAVRFGQSLRAKKNRAH